MTSVRNSPQASDKGMSVASYQQQTYHLRNLSWREMEDSLTRLGGPKLTVTTERNGEVAVFRFAQCVWHARRAASGTKNQSGQRAGWWIDFERLDAGHAQLG